MKRLSISLSVLFIALGGAVYLFFNQQTHLFSIIPKHWFIPKISTNNTFIDTWVISYGADLFWMIAFALAVNGIIELPRRHEWKLFFCAFLGVIVELMQLCHFIDGTPDVADIATYCLGCLLAIGIIQFLRRVINENNTQN